MIKGERLPGVRTIGSVLQRVVAVAAWWGPGLGGCLVQLLGLGMCSAGFPVQAGFGPRGFKVGSDGGLVGFVFFWLAWGPVQNLGSPFLIRLEFVWNSFGVRLMFVFLFFSLV